jgi:hypothetical protein
MTPITNPHNTPMKRNMSRAGSLNSTNAEKKASANLLHRFYLELAARRLNPHTFNPALPNHDRKMRSPFQSHTSMRSRNVNSTRKRPKPAYSKSSVARFRAASSDA